MCLDVFQTNAGPYNRPKRAEGLLIGDFIFTSEIHSYADGRSQIEVDLQPSEQQESNSNSALAANLYPILFSSDLGVSARLYPRQFEQ